jgi:hypothetical protein
MNLISKKLYQWQLEIILKKKCKYPIVNDENGITDAEGKKLNCYDVAIDKDTEPFFYVEKVQDDKLVGRLWNGTTYNSQESSISIDSIADYRFSITHRYGYSTVRYATIYGYLISKLTYWPYIRIDILTWLDRHYQYLFNKKRIVTKKRIEVLKAILNHYFESTHSGINIIDLMVRLYSIRWVLHPGSDDETKKIQLYLDSLIVSGDIQKVNEEYVVLGKALTTIEQYEREERNHVGAVKLQRRMFYLTFILAIAAVVQAGFLKVPPILDFTKEAGKQSTRKQLQNISTSSFPAMKRSR